MAALSPRPTAEYSKLTAPQALAALDSSPKGLTDAEALARTKALGPNEIPEKKRSPLLDFLSRFWGPMPWLLELAAGLSLFLDHDLEAAVILGLLTVNALIGFRHARGSQRALQSLKRHLAARARVLRDGTWVETEARNLVPGDVAAVRLGDIVPADAILLEGAVSVDQSALTGESLPVEVKPAGIVYSGSTVRRGEARGLVVNTGPRTYFGRTAELIKIARPVSHQERIMLAIVRYMMVLGLAALGAVAVDAFWTGVGALSLLTFAVIFLMGAVPVVLPAVLTIVQSVGATELARKGVLVARLDAIEDTASMDVLCLDKTGTITQDSLSVAEVVPWPGRTARDVLLTAMLASEDPGTDTIDTVVLAHGRSLGIDLGPYRRVSVVPFEPSTKKSEALVESEGRTFRAVKGAPQTVMAALEGVDKPTLDGLVRGLSLKGYRTLGVARSEGPDPSRLVPLGFLALADPPRPDSRDMIEGAKKLGVKPVMLTGDNLAIAREIARRVSIGPKILRMDDLRERTEDEQAEALESCDGLAEIFPEDKYRIVKLLQARGHTVGMTGDGVNDAPALKQAELGIAVSSSTDVAKAAAGVVLAEPGLKVIIDAVTTSRRIYQRMLTWVINKVTKVVQVVGLLTLGFFWMHNMVLSLMGMVLLLFANDFVTMSLATDNVVSTRNPDSWDIKDITLASLVVGALLVAEAALAVWAAGKIFRLPWESLRTFVLLLLVFTSQFRVLIVRERGPFWASRPGRGLTLATSSAVVGFGCLGVSGLLVPPVTLPAALFALAFSAAGMLALDYPKRLVFRRFGL
jgi:H+-transporting ATPase